MKKQLLIFVLGLTISVQATAQLVNTQSGETSFFSETPLENISAKNNQVAAIVNTATGDIAVKIPMTQFVFPNKLMQEHFNENYVESGKFPAASFRGKIVETIDFKKDGVYDVSAKGILEVHGVKQDRTIKGKLTIAKGQTTLESSFDIKLVDHKIDIPTVVFAKIAEVISVKNRWVMLPKK